MKNCPYCGKPIEDNADGCPHCYAAIPHDGKQENDQPVNDEESSRVTKKRNRR